MSASPKWTPGPLKAADETDGIFKWEVMTADGASTASFCNQADATLYAAAPDLYEALEGMVDAYWRGSEDSDDEHAPRVVLAAFAALAKARGEAAA